PRRGPFCLARSRRRGPGRPPPRPPPGPVAPAEPALEKPLLRLAPRLSPAGRRATRGGARAHGHRLDLDPELRADEPADDQQRVRWVRPLGAVRGERRLARLHEAPDVVRAGEEGLEADDVLHGAP